jgi:hypothetical protein
MGCGAAWAVGRRPSFKVNMAFAYKYCNAHGLDILTSLHLKITPPNQFNDPFEFTPHVVCSNPARRIKRFFKDKTNLTKLYIAKKNAGFPGSFREFRKQLRQEIPRIIDSLAPDVPKINRETQPGYLDHISKTYGVLCMSRRRDSLLMWGHYCNRYRGLVIGFDDQHETFRGVNGLHPVKYVRQRVLFDSAWKEGSVDERNFENQIVFSKNEEWSYEEELRQLFLFARLNQKQLDRHLIGYFLPIQAEAIVSVTVGPRCSKGLYTAIQGALKVPHLRHVEFNRAELHETEFKLNFIQQASSRR